MQSARAPEVLAMNAPWLPCSLDCWLHGYIQPNAGPTRGIGMSEIRKIKLLLLLLVMVMLGGCSWGSRAFVAQPLHGQTEDQLKAAEWACSRHANNPYREPLSTGEIVAGSLLGGLPELPSLTQKQKNEFYVRCMNHAGYDTSPKP
jgi:hypothetical protein